MRFFLLAIALLVVKATTAETQSWRSWAFTSALTLRNKIVGKDPHPVHHPTTKTNTDPTKVPRATCCGTYTREDVAKCFDKLADLNCDNKLSVYEIDQGRQNHLTYWERVCVWTLTSTSLIMTGCDKNKDGFIDHDEFLNDYEGCLNTSMEMCHVKDICDRELLGPHVCGR